MSDLKAFLDSSVSMFHAAGMISERLGSLGYLRLNEEDAWSLTSGTGYFVCRDHRSVVAFVPGRDAADGGALNIAATHIDSPSWKIRTAGIRRDGATWRLPVEPYGNPIYRTWLDRELEVAGMVCFDDGQGHPVWTPWRSRQPLAIIPSLAIHFNREVNKGTELNAHVNMTALMPAARVENSTQTDPLTERICRDLNRGTAAILAAELFLVPFQQASVIGEEGSRFIVSGRIDNLAMAHAVLESMPAPETVSDRGILAVWFDAEEIGSRTHTGASSVFLDEIVERILLGTGGCREDLFRVRRRSVLLSADMAHALHPNNPDRHDQDYAPCLNGGPVLKSHGNRNYSTDVYSEGHIAACAARAGVTLQKFIMRSDLPCGSTVGPAASSHTSIRAADVGNPQWAMHSGRETAGLEDHDSMITLLREYWRS